MVHFNVLECCSSRMRPVQIQWCDHSLVFLEYFRQLYEDRRFVDVGLECVGKQEIEQKAIISALYPHQPLDQIQWIFV